MNDDSRGAVSATQELESEPVPGAGDAPSFAAIGNRIDALAARHPEHRPTWVDSVLLLGSTLLPLALLLPLLWIEDEAHGRWVLVALVVQWASVLLFASRKLRSLRRRFRDAHRHFADELDDDFSAFRDVIDWLARYPVEALASRMRYVRLRRETLLYRLGLVTGGLDKLGILPLVVAAWLQFKDLRLQNITDLGSINLVGIVLLALLATAYLASWWLLRLSTRLDVCAALLHEALLARGERERGGESREPS